MALRTSFSCEACDENGQTTLDEAIQPCHRGCGYTGWQQEALRILETDLGAEILQRLQQISAYREQFACHLCGACCRLASQDADYATLRQRAEAGDDFARQFTSVFLPYASRAAAREKAPELVAAVLAETVEEPEGAERVFFYHCPYVGEDNRCTVYGTEKRPGICQSYPETPLVFIQSQCAWQPWKQETHPQTLMAHALLQVSESLRQRLQWALEGRPGVG
ncbi:YkgJ family cysteine cluster protein [Vampirovibrio chlorellavorus]|uniref:YkgJ family cysteine cluster protein n=1 Tax=Vampirovibrio chlorellavorus TaxID=758823 RepID=UPI0026F0C7D3|nr:YkgJ family cysteine cluster protein [Vampirovibrio chlorellavorus]